MSVVKSFVVLTAIVVQTLGNAILPRCQAQPGRCDDLRPLIRRHHG
jgi:hypothetical protein